MNAILRTPVVILFSLMILAFCWPLSDARLTSTFGESRWDHFHDGVDLVNIDGKIISPADGKLVFMWDKTFFPLDNYPGGGNYKIIRHGEIYSIYMHMEDGNPSSIDYKEGEPVGRMGNTGHSFSAHLHTCLYNGSEKVSMNPLLIMPALMDEKPPVITSLLFHIGENYTVVRDKSDIRLTKHHPLLVDAIDVINGREHLGVYRLAVTVNGKQVCDFRYDRIKATPEGSLIAGYRSEDIFDEKGYYRIPGIVYNEGTNVIEVTAADYAGNESSKTFSFNVRLDMENR